MFTEKDYVNLHIAIKLQKAGYADSTTMYYGKGRSGFYELMGMPFAELPDYAAPTLYEAMIWLLQNKSIQVWCRCIEFAQQQYQIQSYDEARHHIIVSKLVTADCFQSALALAIERAVGYLLSMQEWEEISKKNY